MNRALRNWERGASTGAFTVETSFLPAWSACFHPTQTNALRAAKGIDAVLNGEVDAFELHGPLRDGGPERAHSWLSAVPLPPEMGDGALIQLGDIVPEPAPDQAGEPFPNRHEELVTNIDEGYAVVELIPDGKGGVADVRFLETNAPFATHTGLSDAAGKSMRELMPGTDAFRFGHLLQVDTTGEAARFTVHSEVMNRWFDVFATKIGDRKGHRLALLLKDVTAPMRAELDQQLMERLNELIRLEDDPDEIGRTALEWLCAHFEVDRALLAEVDPIAGMWNVDLEFAPAGQVLLGLHSLNDFSAGALKDLREGRELVVSDSSADARTSPMGHAAFAQVGIQALLFLPVFRSGRWASNLVLAHPAPRAWSAQEIATAKLIADRLWSAMEKKRALRALRESEERFRAVSDVMSQFAWLADANGSLYWYNKRWYDYTGTTPEEMQGWGWRAVHHPDHVERVVARIQESWDTGKDWEDLFPLRSKEGHYRWFLSRAQAVRDEQGRITRWVGTNTDITDQLQSQRMLEESQAELAQAVEQLRRSDERKTRFLATLSHELRNPLAPIRSAVHLLEDAPRTSDEHDQARSVLIRQVRQLEHLVDDLLDLSRIENDKLVLRKAPTKLAELVDQAVETSRPIIAENKHHLIVDQVPEGAVIDADATRITQVLANLLNNAARYTPAGGRIQLRVEILDDEARVQVIDNGIGIPHDRQDRVFEMFTQAHASELVAQGGLGIGLSLVKRLVELHGGRVMLRSEGTGQGSTFTVSLPLHDQAATNRDARRPAFAAPSRRVLIVDDNEDAAVMLAHVLRRDGHEAHVAHDGAEGVAAAGRLRPEFILMDIGMPVMDGHEACRRIRTHDWGKGIFITALTGWGQEDDIAKAKAAGFDHHLLKPVSRDQVSDLLARMPISAE